jgi:nifR3 family TIM-barrel protein
MAGITDLPFRRLVARFGAGLVVSEMVACREVVTARPSKRARARMELGAQDAGTAVQIAGCDAHWMAEAARLAEGMGARIVDINMGCPAKKVTGGQSGSALMRTPDLALRLIEAVVAAVSVPVTLKCRLGWDLESLNADAIARQAEAAGVAMITVHGRTRNQFYNGEADWAAIARVRDAVRVPVIANGDIVDVGTGAAALRASGAEGVMVGRGARGAPWRLAEIAAGLYGAPAPDVPKGAALGDMVAGHYEAMLGFYGVDLGLRVARKHLGWYLDGAGVGDEQRRAILTGETPARVLEGIGRAFAPAAGGDAPAAGGGAPAAGGDAPAAGGERGLSAPSCADAQFTPESICAKGMGKGGALRSAA